MNNIKVQPYLPEILHKIMRVVSEFEGDESGVPDDDAAWEWSMETVKKSELVRRSLSDLLSVVTFCDQVFYQKYVGQIFPWAQEYLYAGHSIGDFGVEDYRRSSFYVHAETVNSLLVHLQELFGHSINRSALVRMAIEVWLWTHHWSWTQENISQIRKLPL